MTPEQTALAMSGNDGPNTPEAAELEQLFYDLESPLHGYALKLVQRPDTAQDLVQEAFMRLHARFREVRQPRLWLYRTVHNLAMNHHRAARKIVAIDFEGDGASAGSNAGGTSEDHRVDVSTHAERLPPDEQAARNEAVEQARKELNGLDPRARELIRLKFEEGMSYKEMSERTGLSVGYVGNILHHAIQELAQAMEREGGGR